MANQQLVSYIQEQLKAGAVKTDILKALNAIGWSAPDVSEAFSVIEGTAPATAPATPPMQAQVPPPATPAPVVPPVTTPTPTPAAPAVTPVPVQQPAVPTQPPVAPATPKAPEVVIRPAVAQVAPKPAAAAAGGVQITPTPTKVPHKVSGSLVTLLVAVFFLVAVGASAFAVYSVPPLKTFVFSKIDTLFPTMHLIPSEEPPLPPDQTGIPLMNDIDTMPSMDPVPTPQASTTPTTATTTTAMPSHNPAPLPPPHTTPAH